MKRVRSLLVGAAILLAFAEVVYAISVTLAWDASPSPEVKGYRIYYGPASRTYTNITDVGNVLSATITNIPPNSTSYYAATAYDTNGLESDFSNEVSYRPPPVALCSAPASVLVMEGAQASGGP